MATNTQYGSPLTGLDAELASLPLSASVRGGTQDGFNGVMPATAVRDPQGAQDDATEQPGESLGELMDADDQTVFKTVNDLVLRQERLAKNHLAQDRHWIYIKLGLSWSFLEQVQDQDIYLQDFAPGAGGNLRPSAVPNKAADLVNKLAETLMVDPPRPAPQAENDSETAERAAEMAEEFLLQDGGENGTDDDAVFWSQIERAACTASTYNHYWVDKQGGGSIPLQIKAHPQATDPAHPLTAIDPTTGQPIPTTDYVLRYVTAQQQFTDNPSEAQRQWLPKQRIEKWGREHIRIYPEDKDVQQATAIVGLFYCTLGEAKRRWSVVAEMQTDEQGQLCDWSPPRYMALLPPALRARWKLQTGNERDPKGGSNDERVMFYYAYYRVSSPDYPQGAAIMVNGMNGGTLLDRDTLSATVEMPAGDQDDKTVTDLRMLDIPIVQIRLIQDPDELDPTGTAFMRRLGPTNEARARLCTSYLQSIDIILNPARFCTATSPVEGWQVEESRGSGDFVSVLSAADFPKYEEYHPLPPSFPGMIEWVDTMMDSSSGLNKPAQGSDNQQEVSGVARKVAVQQSLVSLSRMQQAVNAAYARHCRIKCQLAMKHFTVPQQLRYVGEDGAYKQEWWTGTDFALVTDIKVKPGTGTMMPPQEKVNYVAMLRSQQFMDQDEAADAARPAFADALGLPENVHQQRIERQIAMWLEGPPEGWVQQYAQYQQQLAAYQQQAQAVQQQNQIAMQQHATATQGAAALGVAPSPAPGQVPMPQAPVPPYTPFAVLPMDDEMPIASIRKRRLAKLMATVAFNTQPKPWQSNVTTAYTTARQAVALAGAAIQNAGAQQKLSGDLERIKLQSGLTDHVPGAAESETEAVKRDEKLIPSTPNAAG